MQVSGFTFEPRALGCFHLGEGWLCPGASPGGQCVREHRWVSVMVTVVEDTRRRAEAAPV